MATIVLPTDASCSDIAHNTAFNANYDIVWSFDFALSGSDGHQGSFTTFLFNGSSSLTVGGMGAGGAYYDIGIIYLTGGNYTISTDSSPTLWSSDRFSSPGPTPPGDPISTLTFYDSTSSSIASFTINQEMLLAELETDIISSVELSAIFVSAQVDDSGNPTWTFSGGDVLYVADGSPHYWQIISYDGQVEASSVDGAILGINFDTTGLFATSGTNANGLAEGIPNSLSIRYGETDFDYLTSVALTSLYTDFNLLLSSQEYSRLRFRLTDVGQTLVVDYKPDTEYVQLLSIPVDLAITDSTTYKIGIGYTTPVSGISPMAKFSIKNFHVEGNTSTPDYEISTPRDNSFAVYPVCALPTVEAPNDPTVVRTLDKIPEVVCVSIDDSEVSRGICLADFIELSGTDGMGVSALSLAGSYFYTISSVLAPPASPDPKPIIEACATDLTDIISFDGNTRDLVDFPASYTAIIGAASGQVGLDYEVYDQSVRFEVYYDNNLVINTGYVDIDDNATYNLRSELALRDISVTAITAVTANTVYFNKTTSTPTSAEIKVYGPVDGARYTIAMTCPRPTPVTYNCGTLITGTNYTSPLSSDYIYTPFTINVGTGLGTINFFYSAFGLPERFQVVYDNAIILDTGWCGLTAEKYIEWLNSYLLRNGQEQVDTLNPSTSVVNITKSTASPTTMEVRVYAPLYNSNWAISAGCPGAYIASFSPTSFNDHIEVFP